MLQTIMFYTIFDMMPLRSLRIFLSTYLQLRWQTIHSSPLEICAELVRDIHRQVLRHPETPYKHGWVEGVGVLIVPQNSSLEARTIPSCPFL